MIRSLVLAVVVLGAFAQTAAAAVPPAPSVSVDPRFAVAGKGIQRTDLASNFAADTPNAVAVDGNRIYSVGEADGNVAIIAQTATGTFDSAFSGDGKLTVPLNADPARDFGTSIIVLPDHRLRIVAATDIDPATGTSNLDIALFGLLPDGSFDPDFTTTTFGVSASGDDQPTRAAWDPATGRIAIAGYTNGQNDSFVSVRNADGSPAAFGVDGTVVRDAGSGLTDQAVDIAWRPGGGLAVLEKVETDPSDTGRGWISIVGGLTETGEIDTSFSGGYVQIAVGEPDTTPAGLLAWGGKLWVTGSTKENGDTNAYLARMAPDGSGIETRTFDMHGASTKSDDAVSSQGIDLDVLENIVPTLVIVGSTTNLSGAAEWSAAAFNGLDGPVASMGYGDLTIPYDQGQGAAVSVDAGGAFLGVAGSLLVTSPSAELSFGSSRLLIDADKECDLALVITRPLELTMLGGAAAPIKFSVTNNGRRLCRGTVVAPPNYALNGVRDSGIVGPSETVTMDLTLNYTGIRKFDDIAPFKLDVAGDSDASNNTKLIHVVFNFCDVRLRAINAPTIMPSEGGKRVAFSVRNAGTMACRDSRVAAVAGGSREDAGDRYTVAPARSVDDDAVLEFKANAPVGKNATLTVGARSRDEAARDEDGVTLHPLVVGVGDSSIRSASARSISGRATGAGGPQKPSLRALTRVEVSVKQLGGTKKKPTCAWLRSRSGTVRRGSCTSAVWLRASGTSSWRLSLKRALPKGKYEIRSRAVIRAGFREARFSTSDRNLVKLTVR